MRHSDEAFADWVRRVFDHPVTSPLDIDAGDDEPADIVDHLTRLFEEPDAILVDYSDAQVNQGLYFLVDDSCSGCVRWLIEPAVDWAARLRGVRAIARLYERLFARRCPNRLSHRDEAGASPLSHVCYMWWDIFPTLGEPGNPYRTELDAELLGVMRGALALDSVACQESALHGLGHWQMHYPGFVEQAVNEFLAGVGNMRPELLRYAQCARRGYML